MAASVWCRRLPGLRCIPDLRKGFARAQHMHIKPEDEADDLKEKRRLPWHNEVSLGGYRLNYNPSSYQHSALTSAVSCNVTDDDEDEQCVFTHVPSFWQQSNRYSVSCSRHLSSSKNTLLDLAFSKNSEPEVPSVSPGHKKARLPDVKVDTRAFHKCRPEYASVTLDLNQRPQQISWWDAMQLLQKVSVLKGSMKTSDVLQFLTDLSRLHPDKMPLLRSDQRFTMLLRYSVEHLRHFTEPQLLEVLRAFVWLDVPSAHTLLSVYEAELSHRAGQMTLHQLMLAADLWRCIGKQVPQFLQHLRDSVGVHLGEVGVAELVQLLYIMGEGRHCPKEMIRPLEQLLMHHLEQLHPEEVGTIFLGLFKSQTSISESALNRIVEKALTFVKQMSDFAIVNVLKYLRFSYTFHRAWLEAMAQEVPQRAHRMGVQGLMHVALTCSALHYSNDSILTAVAMRVPFLVAHCRSKDSCKLLWAYGTLGFLPLQSPNFYPSLTESLRQRKAEFQRYPEHLLTALLGLAFVSQFPEDLIALALNPDFISSALKSTQLELKKDLFTLDETVALELPQWTGPRLRREIRDEVREMLWKFAQSDVCQKPEVLEAESALKDLLGGEEFVCKRMILPHTRSIDLEVHLDSTGRPVPVNVASLEQSSSTSPSNKGWERFNVGVTITDDLLAQIKNKNTTTTKAPLAQSPEVRSVSLHRLQPDESGRMFDTGLDLTSDIIETLTKPRPRGFSRPNSKGSVKVAIQVSNRNQFCSQSQQLLGLHAMKRRQLKLAGYRVVELGYREWFPLLRKSRTEKLAYLHCKLFDCL